MKRIFIQNITLGTHILDHENLNYLTKTLRFKNEEKLLVFDGEQEALAIFQPKNIIKIISILRSKESTFLKLAIAEIQKDRLEWTFEKATELGISEIILLKTARTQKSFNMTRLEKILIASCKQCGRISIPKFKRLDFNGFITEAVANEWVFGSLNTTFSEIPEKIKGAIIGPEGGWSEEEERILHAKFKAIHLNHNILRADTAAITALSWIVYNQLHHIQNQPKICTNG